MQSYVVSIKSLRYVSYNLGYVNWLAPAGFYTEGRQLVKSNLIGPSDKLSWRPGCPVLNNNIQGNFCISQGNGFSDNLPENLVYTPALGDFNLILGR